MKAKAILLSLVTAFFLSAPALAKDASQKAKNVQLIGCLSQQSGSYVLTNKQYPDGVKLSTTENLKDHIGHKVEVKGTWDTLPSTGSAKQNEMTVTSFKHISSTCDTTPAAGTKY